MFFKNFFKNFLKMNKKKKEKSELVSDNNNSIDSETSNGKEDSLEKQILSDIEQSYLDSENLSDEVFNDLFDSVDKSTIDDFNDTEIAEKVNDAIESDTLKKMETNTFDEEIFTLDLKEVFGPLKEFEAEEPIKEDSDSKDISSKTKEVIDEEKEDVTEKTSFLSKKVFYIIASLLVTLILGLITFFFVMKNKYAIASPKDSILISQPKNTTNKSNYIFIENNNKNTLGVVKILVDTLSTDFYLSSKISVKDFIINLTDNNGRNYNLDELNFDFTNENSFTTKKLQFEPLDSNITFIELNIKSIETNVVSSFKYHFENPVSKTSIRFLSKRPLYTDPNNDFSVILENANFSSSGSTILYSINNSNSEIFTGLTNSNNNINITEGSDVLSVKSESSSFSFNNGNKFIGYIKFLPVNNLNSKINMEINSLVKKVNINKSIPFSIIGQESDSKGEVINFENYNIILERIGKNKNQYVLVMHCEDKNLENTSDFSNRVEIIPDVSLVFMSASGEKVSVKGNPISGKLGTDVVFNSDDALKILGTNVSTQNMHLQFNSFSFSVENISFDLDLESSSFQPIESFTFVKENIEKNFLNRLEYKSGLITKNEIKGFSNSVLENSFLNNLYSPTSKVEDFYYDIEVVSLSSENGKIYAVVNELWKTSKDSKDYDFKFKHKIIVEVSENLYTIVEDSIV